MEENGLNSMEQAKYFMKQIVERLRRVILDYDFFRLLQKTGLAGCGGTT